MDVTSYLLGKKAGGGGETPVLIDKNVNANGTYNASSDEADGYKKVVVNVQPNLESKSITITENKTTLIEPTQGKDGLSSVSVVTNVPQSGGRDWTAIGYSSEPQDLIDGYNYAKDIYDNWDSSITSMENMYKDNSELIFMPLVDTSNVTSMKRAFDSCRVLDVFPSLNTSNVTNFNGTFSYNSLISIGSLDCSKATNTSGMFVGCYDLKNLGGLLNIGNSYETSKQAHNSYYKVEFIYSKNLTHQSLMNVINNLYDIATKGCNTQDLSIGSTNLAKLTAEEIAVATNKGWTVS